MGSRLITIATVMQPLDAHVLKGKLEAEGIQAFLADENIVSLNFLYANAVGGVKVQVDEADADEALRIISQWDPQLELAQSPQTEDPPCSKCGSKEVTRERNFLALALQILTLGFALGGKPKWKCAKCGTLTTDSK